LSIFSVGKTIKMAGMDLGGLSLDTVKMFAATRRRGLFALIKATGSRSQNGVNLHRRHAREQRGPPPGKSRRLSSSFVFTLVACQRRDLKNLACFLEIEISLLCRKLLINTRLQPGVKGARREKRFKRFFFGRVRGSPR
jgi:hypothetical protein